MKNNYPQVGTSSALNLKNFMNWKAILLFLVLGMGATAYAEEFNRSMSAFDQETCNVSLENPTTQNGCAVLPSYPFSSGGAVEFVWALNNNGDIEYLTAWSTSNSLTFCPEQDGDYRICSRVVGCSDIYESNDTHVTVTCGSIAGLHIYDQSTDVSIYGPISNGDEINLSSLPTNYYLATEINGRIGSIHYNLNGSTNTENFSLFTHPGGAEIDDNNWNAGIGNYSVTVKAYSGDDKSGTLCGTLSVNFSIGGGGDCEDLLLNYSGNCNDPDDSFYPSQQASCISSATELFPSNGPGSASCNDGIICLQTSYNNWEFSFSTSESTTLERLDISFLYPINMGTAGGPSNDNWCPGTKNYTVKFYKNGSLVDTQIGSVASDAIITENVTPGSPISLGAGDTFRAEIIGDPYDNACHLFELAGVSVIGCCGVEESCAGTCGTDSNPPTADNLTPAITQECGSTFPDVTFSDDCSNATVVSYEEFDVIEKCRIALSSHVDYTYRNFWFHAFPAQYDNNFVWADGYVSVLSDNTVRMSGRVENNTLAGSGFYIEYYFEALVDYNTWIANGGFDTADQDKYYRLYSNVDFTKPNSIIGFGEFENSDLQLISTGNVNFMDYGPRDVYGGEGVGFWIDYTGTVNGLPAGTALQPDGANHNDMYAAVADCITPSGCGPLTQRLWNVKDDCGNQQIFSQTVQQNDTQGPLLVFGPGDLTVTCEGLPAVEDAIFEDECTSVISVDFSEYNEDLPDDGNAVIRTWTATDECGNTSVYSQTITIADGSINTNATLEPNTLCGNECIEYCYESPTDPEINAQIATIDDVNQTVTIRTTFSKNFVDNTYGTNQIGWDNTDHTFDKLVGSDHLIIGLTDANGVIKMQMKLDYISGDNSAPSGYASLGVESMISGNESDVISVTSSLAENLNTFGYNLTENSPATDAEYSPNPSYPNWIFEVWYEVTVSLNAFGAAGFGSPTIEGLHASPSKTGNNSEEVVFVGCCGYACNGSIDLNVESGTAPFTFEWSNGATTEDLSGLCPGDYTVVITDSNGCTGTSSYTVVDEIVPVEASATSYASATCGEEPFVPMEQCDCACDGKMQSITLQYLGADGATIAAYEKDDQQTLINSYTNVQNGQVLTFSAVGLLDNDEFESKTFVYINGGQETEIHTSCSQDIAGLTIGQFKVIGYADGNGIVCDASNCFPNCECDGKMRNLTLLYNGPSNATIEAFDDDNGSGILISSESNVQSGQIIYVDAFGVLPGDDFESKTFLQVNGGAFTEIHTSCSQDIGGGTFGDFTVIAYTDGAGNTCGETQPQQDCSGFIDLTVNSGVAPFTYLWSNGATSEDLTEVCGGTYSVTITGANGCSTVVEIIVEDEEISAGSLSADSPICKTEDTVILSAQVLEAPSIPAGFETIYVLTQGSELIITQASTTPEFSVDAAGQFTIHTLVYDPATLDLGTVVFGTTTGFDINALLVQGGGDICGALDVTGAPIVIEEESTVGNYVWYDNNADGCQDDNEQGAEGLTLSLFECTTDGSGNPLNQSGTLVTTTTSDSEGFYQFKDCFDPTKSFYINVSDIPTGFDLTDQDACGNDATDSDANPEGNTECFNIPTNSDNPDFDFGLKGLPNVGDYVWYDDNQNGIQDGDENPVQGVTVNLISAGDDGLFHTTDDVVADTQTTGSDGLYLFESVLPGAYCIEFLSSSLPADYIFTTADQGGDDDADSDADAVGKTAPFTVTAGQEDDLSYDAGIYLPMASLGDYVWIDTNRDGIQGDDENGYEGMSVSLYTCGSTDPIATTTTDENGFYIFNDLMPNQSYYVQFDLSTAPAGYEFTSQNIGDDTTDSDVDADGNTACVELGPNEFNGTLDAGIFICAQIIIVQDVPEDFTIECDEEVPPPVEPIFSDPYDNNLDITFIESENPLPCGYEIVRTWDADNNCGNRNTATYTITITDSTPPTLNSSPDPVTIGCNDPLPGLSASFSDNCDTQLDIALNMSEELLDCGNKVITLTQTATDDCGNSAQAVITINVIDNEAPSVEAPADATVDCENGTTDPSQTGEATGSDACSDVTITFADGTASGECPGSFVRTWTATDACGNTATDSQMIMIIDETAPTLNIPDDVTVSCNASTDTSATGSATADDACSTVVISYVDGLPSGSCPYSFNRNWTATDVCGNTATGVQIISVVDEEAPVIDGVPSDVTVECIDDVPGLPLITANDACDQDVNITLALDEDIDGCIQTITRIFTATDECGNSAVESYTITVNDTTPPTLNSSPDPITIGCNDPLPSLSASFSDNCDNQLNIAMTMSEEVLDCGNKVIILTQTAVDDCGNTAQAFMTINVIDNEAPSIEAPSDASVDCDNGTTDPSETGEATGSDDCSDIIITYTDGSASGECPGSFVRTWTATDACGNTATDDQLIMIIDETAPIITAADDIQIECGEEIPAPAHDVSDACSSTQVDVSEVEAPGCGDTYTITRTYTATDVCGNTATDTQIITIVDTTPPSITANPDGEAECKDAFNLGGYQAEDSCGEVTVTIDSTFNASCGGSGRLDILYTATDACGNTATAMQMISIDDTTAPYFVNTPGDATVNCNDIPSPLSLEAEDLCSDASVEFLNEVASDGCPYTITRTWLASDECGNTATYSRVLTVVDTTAPVLAGVPDDISGACGVIPVPAVVSASDNCSGTLPVEFSEEDQSQGCHTLVIRTWTATDDCGNTSSATQTIEYLDDVAPEIFCPADAEVDCAVSNTDPANTGFAGATDNCNDDVDLDYSDGPVSGDCPSSFIRTWTATDECGNTATCEQMIMIIDETAPTIEAGPDASIECGDQLPAESYEVNDLCSQVQVSVSNEELPACGETYTLIRTYTATDACGNTAIDTQTITVVDTTPPSITANPDGEAECGDAYSLGGYQAEDSCGEVTVAIDSTFNASCGGSGRLDILYTATDACGNTATAMQMISIDDTTAPVFVNTPGDATVNCDDIPSPMSLEAEDLCSDASVEFLNEVASDGCPYTLTRTWVASDECGNTATYSRVLTVVDTTAPVLAGVPDDISGECGDLPDPANVTASDNCSTSVSVTLSEDDQSQDCHTLVIRTWTATDACGNTATASQTIEFIDDVAPEISCPGDVTAECGTNTSMEIFGTATATDNCGEVDIVRVNSFEPACGNSGILTRTWTATDECGNTNVCFQLITIVDTTAPELSAAADTTIECGELIPAQSYSVSDECGEVEVIVSETEAQGCGNTSVITRTYTATDACGNSSVDTQTINVVDTTPPSITANPDGEAECEDAFNLGGYQAEDSCGEVTVTIDSTFNATCGGSGRLDILYTATDACGNTATAMQMISIDDTTAPYFVNTPGDATVNCNDIPSPLSLEAEDLCSDASVEFLNEVASDGCPYTITRTWLASDECGNTATYSRVLTVVDTTAPVLAGVPDDISGACGVIPVPAVVSASDNCSGTLPVEFSEEDQSQGCHTLVIRTWTATDDCGNTSSATQTIEYLDDVAPEIFCPADAEVDCAVSNTDPANTGFAGATDNCNDDVDLDYSDGPVSGDCPSSFIRTWTATDECGNTATCEQMIMIIDETAPTIEAGPDASIECGDQLPAESYEVNDLCSQVQVSVSNEELPACGETYTLIRTYTATDACGNTAIDTQTITVVDTTPPSITANPDGEAECGDAYSLGGYQAEDSCGEVTVAIDSTFNASCGGSGRLDILYTATDACGNTATAMQMISIDDTTAPVFVNTPGDATVNCDDIPSPMSLEAEDLCSDASVEFLNEVASDGCPYTLTRTWVASDECGNTATYSRVLTVVDTTAPVLAGVPDDISGECGDLPDPANVTASDNCSTSVSVTLSEDDQSQDCHTLVIRTWTATDACGNTATASQTIEFIDDVAPEISCPGDVTAECGTNTSMEIFGTATATDNCGEVDIVRVNTFESACGNSGVLTRTWTATDECGNTSVCFQLITIVDTTPPALSAAADTTIECGELIPAQSYDVSDECGEVEVVVSETEAQGCGSTSVITRTYTATDACGNSSVDTQTINVVDTTPPSITANPSGEAECEDAFNLGGYQAEDSCGEVTVTIDSTFNASCGGSGRLDILYTATDACGNTATAMQMISIDDTTDPYFVQPIEDMTVECTDIPEPAQLIAADDCGAVQVSYNGQDMTSGCPFTITRSWTATDECGNTATHTQVITVEDTTPPALNAELNISIECNDPVPAAVYVVTDLCDDDVPVEISTEEVLGNCGDTRTIFRTLTATDACGNTSVLVQQIDVIDNTPPALTCPGPITLDCADLDLSLANTGEATATDECNAEVIITFEDGELTGDCPSSFIRTFIATDDCGNTSTCDQVITIVDETAPSLTIPADAIISCEQIPLPFNTGQATATDACAGLTVNFTDSEMIGSCPATFTRTWIAGDGCGNTTVGDQLITIVDETAPELISMPGDLSLECGDLIPEGEALFSDNCDDELEETYSVQENPLSCGYEIVRTWTATDDCNNSTVHVQTITVTDTENPFFIQPPSNLTVDCTEIPLPASLNAEDGCDSNVEIEYLGETTEGVCPLIITRSWKATDDCQNTAMHTQTITVIDEIAPELIAIPDDVSVNCSDIPAVAIPSALDNCDDDVNITFNEIENGGTCPFTIVRTWTAIDACGNSSQASQTITVTDEVSPVFGSFPATTEVYCDDLADYTVPVTDNCSTVDLDFTDVTFSGQCLGTIERTWIATDACGNTAVAIQFLFLRDSIAPSLVSEPQDFEVNCQEPIPAPPVVEATDNCDDNVEIVFSETQSGTDCPYVITRTWTLTDECGNVAVVDQMITVVTNIVVDDVEIKAVPNPFNGEVTLSFALPYDGFVVLEVFNSLGSTMEIVFKGYAIEGILYEFKVNGDQWEDGVYYSRLIYDGESKTERIIKAE